MRIKSSLYFLGLSCLPISIMSLINIFYSFYFNYLQNVSSYILVLIISLVFGLALIFIGKKASQNIGIYEQLFLTLAIFFILPLLILVPFFLSDYNVTFLDSYFESVSGFTGTGFSIFENVKNLDPPLILWRSSSQWIGGFYFVIFLILIFSNKQLNFKMIDLSFNLEKKISFSSNLISVTNRIFFIYLFLTIFVFFGFLISGIRIFDSLNLTMTVVSSGGFLSVESLGDIIKTNLQSLYLSITFLISILNFYIIYNLIFNREMFKKHKEDLYLVILTLIFTIFFFFLNDTNLAQVLVNVLSSIGNSGLSLGETPKNFGLFFIVLTLIGGSVLSNTSGLKFIRLYILIKGFTMEIVKLVKPNLVINKSIMFSENQINTENIKMSFLIFILFFLSLFILSSILLIDFLDFENSFKLSILTLTNTAPSNIYSIDNILFADLFTFSKISLIIFMVIAKVELLAIFLLFRKVFFKD